MFRKWSFGRRENIKRLRRRHYQNNSKYDKNRFKRKRQVPHDRHINRRRDFKLPQQSYIRQKVRKSHTVVIRYFKYHILTQTKYIYQFPLLHQQ